MLRDGVGQSDRAVRPPSRGRADVMDTEYLNCKLVLSN